MAERLEEIGNALGGIGESVKLVKSLKSRTEELLRILEVTSKQAEAVLKIKLSEERELQDLQPLLEDFLIKICDLQESISKLLAWLPTCESEIELFEAFVKDNFRHPFAQENVLDFCEHLNRLKQIIEKFGHSVANFAKNVNTAHGLALDLTAKLRQKEQEMQTKAKSVGKWGNAKTVGLGVASAALGVLGFFTLGLAAIPALLCARAAINNHTETKHKVKELQDFARDILNDADNMNVIAKRLQSSCNRAEGIALKPEDVKSLQAALEFLRRDMEKDARLSAQEAEIAALKARLRDLGE